LYCEPKYRQTPTTIMPQSEIWRPLIGELPFVRGSHSAS
jgi:hypothetical protein